MGPWGWEPASGAGPSVPGTRLCPLFARPLFLPSALLAVAGFVPRRESPCLIRSCGSRRGHFSITSKPHCTVGTLCSLWNRAKIYLMFCHQGH